MNMDNPFVFNGYPGTITLLPTCSCCGGWRRCISPRIRMRYHKGCGLKKNCIFAAEIERTIVDKSIKNS